MMLTEKRLSLSRAKVIGLVLATSIEFGAGTILTYAMSLQVKSEHSNAAKQFARTWHRMFDGRSFVTIILVPTGSGFTGTVTPSRIKLNDDGALLRAVPGEDATPKPIDKAMLEGSALRINVSDGVQFTVTLNDDTHAEIHPMGAPQDMKAIPAEKVH
jgi:hypothetical protein